MARILIVDDERKITELLAERIAAEGMDAATAASAEEALPAIERGEADVVLCDLRLAGMDGIELLRRAKQAAPDTDVVIMTAYASAETAVEAMRRGAYEYLIKPFQMDEVVMLLRRIIERRDLVSENAALRDRLAARAASGRIVGESPAIKAVRDLIALVAPADAPVLVLGESGTGKELVAAEIHARSLRARKPFVVLNAAAVPETLLEAELFGYERGAFTGAVARKMGQFKLAEGGTLFMDEIGDMPPPIQAKLLRAIELKQFLPLGGSKPVTVDVRIVAATNHDLEDLVRAGRFREDLFYRLNVFPIRIPPLRDRREDIIPIAEHFLREWKGAGRGGAAGPVLDAEASAKLTGYAWPGNVRELRNVLERATILSGGSAVPAAHILIEGERGGKGSVDERLRSLLGEAQLPAIEKRLVELALEASNGNKSRAAAMLGITRRALYGRLEKLGGDAEAGEESDGR